MSKAATTITGPRVFDGRTWKPIQEGIHTNHDGDQPVEPILDGDGKIFVSIVSYRDGERCGDTLRSLFQNAKDPDNIIVGLFEQNAPEDKFCIETYCSSYGVKTLKRVTMRKDVVKIVASDSEILETCPHYHQIRLVAYHHIQAKGPTYARSLVRKVLGNEEFCMQVDAHTEFIKHWDDVAVTEWKATKNEFGIISNVPADKKVLQVFIDGDDTKMNEVPRQCLIRFLDNGFPDYAKPADGKVVELTEPLLGHGWSAGFSFAKCHLEETVPYDNFSVYSMPIEQFSRYARLWTRGYDVYTPTKNIVYHDYGMQANGHGSNEWFKRQRDRFRQMSVERVKTVLQMPGGMADIVDQANLGIYGLGKRRSLEQLMAFTNIDLKRGRGTTGTHCDGHKWVPYDTSISPAENLFNNPDNLDPQPEYPLRTSLIYYHPSLDTQSYVLLPFDEAEDGDRELPEADTELQDNNSSSTGSIFMLWILGLVVYYMVFTTMSSGKSSPYSTDHRKKSSDISKVV